jgi:hypothetical protein
MLVCPFLDEHTTAHTKAAAAYDTGTKRVDAAAAKYKAKGM